MKLFLLALLVASAAAAMEDYLIDCESQGRVDNMQIEDCEDERLPCSLRGNQVYETAFDFTTAKNSDVVYLVVTYFFGDDSAVIIDEAIVTDVIGNKQYKLQFQLLPNDFLGNVFFQIQLLDKADDHQIICSVAPMIIR